MEYDLSKELVPKPADQTEASCIFSQHINNCSYHSRTVAYVYVIPCRDPAVRGSDAGDNGGIIGEL